MIDESSAERCVSFLAMGDFARNSYASTKQISATETLYTYCFGKGTVLNVFFPKWSLMRWSVLNFWTYMMLADNWWVVIIHMVVSHWYWYSLCLICYSDVNSIQLQAKRMDVVWGETAGVDGQLWLLCPILFIMQVISAFLELFSWLSITILFTFWDQLNHLITLKNKNIKYFSRFF